MSAPPTQCAYPWRAAARTVIQLVIALAAAAPVVVQAINDASPGMLGAAAGVVLGVAAAITRVMAIPAVNDLLTTIGLGAAPKGLTTPTDRRLEWH